MLSINFFYPTFIFSITILLIWIIYIILGEKYALDKPGSRKGHKKITPQLGGLVFSPLLLLFTWHLGLVQSWYIICGLVTIILGATDDVKHISWKIKLSIQLILGLYISSIFWGQFDSISFYNLTFSISQTYLLIVFLFWFVGIYNAVNLLDGLDGLAGGFIFIICINTALINNSLLSEINLILAILLVGFLIFNQRSAMLFMGDAGSLFLGYHIAVLPLLYLDGSNENLQVINMTPFVLLVSYLIADTTRVFITRLASRKSPMTADTIHFHHLLLQQSGSYLSSILSIYTITTVLSIISLISFSHLLSNNIMILHLSLLLIFILSPPIQTYVPVITKVLKPFYNWQRDKVKNTPSVARTLFISVIFSMIIFSLFLNYDISLFINFQYLASIIFIILFISFSNYKIVNMYVIQTFSILLVCELFWNKEIHVFSQMFSTFLIVSYIVFTLQRRSACNLSKLSSLDLLIILITLSGLILSFFEYGFSNELILTILSIWFGLSFILRRTIYLEFL